MKSILILGAGRSSSALIDYFLHKASGNQWRITVGDVSVAAAKERIGTSAVATAIAFDITQESSHEIIRQHDVVVSLIPANLHPAVARLCLQHGKHLFTA